MDLSTAAISLMTFRPVIVWFRNDLRLSDHSALRAASESGRPIIPVYILDDASAGKWALGATARWWLHASLENLSRRLEELGSPLILARGEVLELLPQMAKASDAVAVYCSRAYEPFSVALETRLNARLGADDVAFKRFSGTLLREPEDLRTQSGEPFKVYTPFWRAISRSGLRASLMDPPPRLFAPSKPLKSERLEDWALLPRKPDWAGGLRNAWTPGEPAAQKRLDEFMQGSLSAYSDDRNRPDHHSTSRLSPHLHFGEISPARCWHAAQACAARDPKSDKGCERFLKELVWREFSYHLLFHWPTLPERPWRSEFERFPWRRDSAALRAWQQGLTGYPIVDAGMRELWKTGWMHNRVRMIVASFLVKDLLISWQEGEAWFWDTLVDADLASNAASWQWVAGSGADAAPYFRIFNPVKQGETFDPDGAYVRRFVPELGSLEAKYVHSPWLAPQEALARAGIVMGQTYPFPIVEHGQARATALTAFKALKTAT
jgi:deoxyribodipyrimidine photo-lyase